jgi:hypothetical protein
VGTIDRESRDFSRGRFRDKNELDETVENITNTEKQTISDEEIENLFK